MKMYPLTYKLLRSVESDVKKSLKPKELLTGMDETIFE